MTRPWFLFLASTVLVVPFLAAKGDAATLSASQDVFGYQFLPAVNFNATPPFSGLLSSGNTASGHSTRSLIQFDTTPYNGATLQSATLNLFVGNTSLAGFGVSPSVATPVVVDVARATSAWNESTYTWGTAVSSDPVVASHSISAINQWIQIDITSLVQSWLDAPASNFGVFLTQPSQVLSSGTPVATVYNSSEAATNQPFLELVEESATATTPEPSGLAYAGLAAVSLFGWLGIRKQRCRKLSRPQTGAEAPGLG